ncbi:hypothetical protein [Spirillospora sp. NBC_01491]|uniref:hypothetical protein n=1 Tax=Spirillospora sp. NBC_01491 TaxID=2976007 RepID=UPI002E31D596|nr:hypothetical protein [Spirillospora sp. NBC_01491]
MIRTDLLALTPDALAALANRGLVKRAAKDLDAGNGPQVAVTGEGTVEGVFPDGARTALPAGAGLEAAPCTCAAPGICRHRICLILAYQREAADSAVTDTDAADTAATADGAAGAGTTAPGEPSATKGEARPGPPSKDWSPGGFGDDALAKVFGERALTAARRAFRAGYAARVRRSTADDPVAQVELPTCTVRFLVPGELGYVHTDATAAVRGEMVVLAVWAFRAADERGPSTRGGTGAAIDVGGGAAASGTGMESALELADQVLMEGAMHAGPVLGTALRRSARELTAGDLHWPAAAMVDVAEQLAAYHERRADYEPARFASLLAELHARHRAGGHDGGSPRSEVLGTNESAETPLRRVRLAALGCRIGGTDAERTADVFLAHAGTGVVLVLRRRWDVPEGTTLTGGDVAGRRVSGAGPLRAIATANVVSETASRSASRVVRLAPGRVAKTTVTPLGGAWTGLPPSLLIRDLRAFQDTMDALPPRLVRPRVEAELVKVVEIAEVRSLGYHPGDQRLEAVVADAAGTAAVVSATYSAHAPAALDVLAEALKGGPSHLSGVVSRARGGLVIDPVAVLTPDGVVALDLAPGAGTAALDGLGARAADPLEEALEAALGVCADLAHRGLTHVPAGVRARLGQARGTLERVGLRAAAGVLERLAATLDGDDPRRAAESWVDAQIRLVTTAELR